MDKKDKPKAYFYSALHVTIFFKSRLYSYVTELIVVDCRALLNI